MTEGGSSEGGRERGRDGVRELRGSEGGREELKGRSL